jgi:DNA topoisomerase-1
MGSTPLSPTPRTQAEEVGLRYVTDAKPGLKRIPGQPFRYVDARGRPVRNRPTLERIRRLAIPPAWTEVWICPQANGHLQATGRDARGRKQYRYHPDWRALRDETKYHRMLAFGRALPRLRRRVRRDLRRPGLPREKVLAAVVRLLETSLIRVGNEAYAHDNRSYGLTTLLNRHARVRRGEITFRFKGKSGRRQSVRLEDPRLARIVRRCRDLPGQELFAYLDEKGQAVDVGSEDVNAYLREISGDAFTAKDFRTWAGTVLAVRALRELAGAEAGKMTRRRILRVVESVARLLGNTPAVCRKAYIHPDVWDAARDGSLLQAPSSARLGAGLRGEEQAVLRFLRRNARKRRS